MKILVVDDETLIRDVIKEYAINEGYIVIEAGNGEEAIEKATLEYHDMVEIETSFPDVVDDYDY